MPTTITKTTLPASNAGFNLTNATYTTLGSLEAAQWTFGANDVVILTRGNGLGSSDLNLTVPQFSTITQYGGVINAGFINGVENKVYLFRLTETLKDSDGFINATEGVEGDQQILILTY